MTTMIKIKCGCKGQSAEFQDKRYGKDVLLATVSQKGDSTHRDVRCTCCGAVQKKDVR